MLEHSEPYPEQPKKKGFFNKDSRKVAHVVSIIINSLSVLGLAGLCVAHILAPPLFLLSLPSALSVIFQLVLKYAPSKLEDCKDLLLKKLSKEKDQKVIENTYQEVLSNYEKVSERSISLSSRSINSGNVTERIPVQFLYNSKTCEYEPQIVDH